MSDKKLLVVIDMQKDFVTGVLGTKEAQAIIPKVAEKTQSVGRVIYTFDTHGDTYLRTQEGKNLPVPHCVFGTDGHNLVDELRTDYDDRHKAMLYKETFGSVQLGEHVKTLYKGSLINEVELVGVCTDICVISNALLIKAFCPEIKITVDASCCAGVTPQRHKIALEAMKACQIEIINEDGTNND